MCLFLLRFPVGMAPFGGNFWDPWEHMDLMQSTPYDRPPVGVLKGPGVVLGGPRAILGSFEGPGVVLGGLRAILGESWTVRKCRRGLREAIDAAARLRRMAGRGV